MSDAASRAEWSSAPGECGYGVARMASLVCEATRRAALDGATSALHAAAAQPAEAANIARDIAEPILARATIMQIEIDRFRAVARCGRGAGAGMPATGRGSACSADAVRRPAEARLRRARE